MKKLISILGAIGLTATSTTTLISCEKPNNNENGNNKPEPTPEPKKPQEPPKNSNWKLINGFVNEKNNENKNYIGIIKIENGWKIIKWIGKRIDYKYQYKNIYRWDGIGEPQTPKINKNSGEITDWKEQKD